jgi:hypothetical protein
MDESNLITIKKTTKSPWIDKDIHHVLWVLQGRDTNDVLAMQSQEAI